jgi:hypothetical protein
MRVESDSRPRRWLADTQKHTAAAQEKDAAPTWPPPAGSDNAEHF